MNCGRPMRMAIGCPALTIALAGATFSASAAVEPCDSKIDERPGDALERLVTDITFTQCDAENIVAPEHGGAITRLLGPCEAPKVGDRQRLEERKLEDFKGKLRPPVGGTVVRKFGEPDDKGRPSQGITLRTRPGAQVVAPFDSTIIFAGPVRDFGQTLILSTDGGYHFVLAGMTKIYGVEGQELLEGEPVGIMTGTGSAWRAVAGPELYFEIRKNRKPINPLPWLATARLERTTQ